jgi:hypothetical protein
MKKCPFLEMKCMFCDGKCTTVGLVDHLLSEHSLDSDAVYRFVQVDAVEDFTKLFQKLGDGNLVVRSDGDPNRVLLAWLDNSCVHFMCVQTNVGSSYKSTRINYTASSEVLSDDSDVDDDEIHSNGDSKSIQVHTAMHLIRNKTSPTRFFMDDFKNFTNISVRGMYQQHALDSVWIVQDVEGCWIKGRIVGHTPDRGVIIQFHGYGVRFNETIKFSEINTKLKKVSDETPEDRTFRLGFIQRNDARAVDYAIAESTYG